MQAFFYPAIGDRIHFACTGVLRSLVIETCVTDARFLQSPPSQVVNNEQPPEGKRSGFRFLAR